MAMASRQFAFAWDAHVFLPLTLAVYWARKEKILQTQFVTAHGGEWLRIDAHGLTWQDDGNEWLSINPVGLEWRAMSGQRLFFADQMPNPFHIAWADILDVQLHEISKRDYELNILSSKFVGIFPKRIRNIVFSKQKNLSSPDSSPNSFRTS